MTGRLIPSMAQPLGVNELCYKYDLKRFGIDCTDEVEPLSGILGQERAMQALTVGIGIRDKGFNIFAAGPPGIGKMSMIESFLHAEAQKMPPPKDWVYVNNFEDPYRPIAVGLPAGRGRELKEDVSKLVQAAKRGLKRAFESDDYSASRESITKELERSRNEVFERIAAQCKEEGFAFQPTPYGLALVPLAGDRPMAEEEFNALPLEERKALGAKRESLDPLLKAGMKETRDLELKAQERLQEIDENIARFILGGLIEDLSEKYEDVHDAVTYLSSLLEHALKNIGDFRPSPQPEEPMAALTQGPDLSARKYEVNLLVDNARSHGAPVIIDFNPTYTELFGRAEKEAQFGSLYTDFTLIQAGAIHRANGGFLVLPAEDVIRDPYVWDGLKRCLQTESAYIEDPGERSGYMTSKGLRPNPIPLDVKVILVGRTYLCHLLYAYDEEYAELFKIKAEFDTEMDRTDANILGMLSFMCHFSTNGALRHLSACGAEETLRYATRTAGDQSKISTHFGLLTDLVREADHYAAQDGSERIMREHVKRAEDAHIARSDLIEQKLREATEKGLIKIDTHGERVGQINGLTVIGLGDYSFGRPTRITATVAPGQEGIVDIEREVELGGPIHSKGVMILHGCLMRLYGRHKPLSLSARLAFEQSYEGVEGDSASCAELIALISALSEVPIKQSIAITGSINQQGEIQAIGGVNEKIEGFLASCKIQGITGEQGVVIPESNAKNLMLSDEALESAAKGDFRVWTAATLDDCILLLTGRKADEVHNLARKRLTDFAEVLKDLEKRP